MERIDGIVGNVHADSDLAATRDDHADAGTLERVVLDADNRRRSRFRATTDAGTDVGVIVEKAAVSAGDVLLAADDRMIVVAFEPLEALALELPEPTESTLEAAVELGHRIGNQHWDLAVEDGTVYVPLEADRHIVERVIDDVVPDATLEAVTVEADLFVTDLEHTEHTHGSDHEHSHGSDHTHTHGDDHEHSHATDHEHMHGGHSHEHSHGDGHSDTHEHTHADDHGEQDT